MTFLAAMILGLVAQDQDRIQDLIKKLGSDDFAVRENASEELRKAGKSAREALQKAADDENGDPEVRSRARTLLEELAKAEKRRTEVQPPGRGGGFGLPGSSVMVQSVNGNATYTFKPANEPAFKFHKAVSGQVKLEYTDAKGESKTAEAPTLQAFLKDQSELAARYGITEEGIDYNGSRVSFNGQMPKFNLPRIPVPQRRPLPPPPPVEDEEEEGTAVGGALLTPVDDSLRAQLEIPEGQGVVVTKVTPGSLAAAVGLKKSDVLLEVDGRKITSPDAVKGLLMKESRAVVLRKGKKETLGEKKEF